MIRWTTAAALAAFLLPVARLAAEPSATDGTSACTTLADVQAAALSVSVDTIGAFEGDAAQRWLSAYNAVPPVTSFSADLVVLIAPPGRSAIVVVLLQDDCVTAAWNESRALVERLNAQILGQSA